MLWLFSDMKQLYHSRYRDYSKTLCGLAYWQWHATCPLTAQSYRYAFCDATATITVTLCHKLKSLSYYHSHNSFVGGETEALSRSVLISLSYHLHKCSITVSVSQSLSANYIYRHVIYTVVLSVVRQALSTD